MNNSYIIAGGGFLAIAAITMILRHRGERSRRIALAQRHRWEVSPDMQESVRERLQNTALMHVGHSRRVGAAYRASGRTSLISYEFETGFEHRRQSHDWVVVQHESDHGFSRATITRQSWVAALVRCPAYHGLPLAPADSASDIATGHVAIVEDRDQWQRILRTGLTRWLSQQPPERTWEILPGLIVGYQPGPIAGDNLPEFVASAVDLAHQLKV